MEGRFYSKVVREGESFVIPRGLMHFLYNVGKHKPEIPDDILAKSFQVDDKIIKLLKSKNRKG
jgi:hypothetical protein